jgi:hypothetical protein
MNRANLGVCVLGALLLLAGCKAFDLGLNVAGPAGDASLRILDGSPDQVAVNLQASLKTKGLNATITKNGDTILVESKTGAGMRFAFMLKSKQTAGGKEQTQVALEWMDGRDEAMSLLLIDLISGGKR